jgi:tungstate transport system substrate-binding protein
MGTFSNAQVNHCAVLCAFAAILSACHAGPAPVVLATTTSVANSGLLDHVLPAYEGPTVRTRQVGSGRALEELAAGTANVVISHAPEGEAEMLRRHPGWFYRKVLYNEFLIVGPGNDPANIAGLSDAVTAMKRIAESGQRFLSRGDESGTHERERQLWAATGITPNARQVIVAGAGMGQTLRIASETGAYTLTDRGTFDAFANSLRLRVLVSGDPRLLNTYAVIADPSDEPGIRFARWLSQGDGRRVMAVTLRDGAVRGFTLWPADRNGSQPDARPF